MKEIKITITPLEWNILPVFFKMSDRTIEIRFLCIFLNITKSKKKR